MPGTVTIGRADLERLAAKLDALDLTDEDVLHAARRELAGEDVRGFGPQPHIRGSSFFDVLSELFPPGTRTTVAGPGSPPGSEGGIIIWT